MSIKTKKAGSYVDAVAVFVKKGGVYAAVAGVFAKVGGAYQSVLTAAAAPMSAAVRARSGGAALTITPATDAAANTVYTVTSSQGSLIDFSAGTAALNRFLGNMVNGTAYPLTVTSSVGGVATGSATISVTPTAVAATKTTIVDQIIVFPSTVAAANSTSFVDPNRTKMILKAPADNTATIEVAPNSNANNNFNGVWTEVYQIAPGQEIELTNDTRRIMSRLYSGVVAYNQKLIIESEITL